MVVLSNRQFLVKVAASEPVHSDLGCSFFWAHHFSLPGSALQAPSIRILVITRMGFTGMESSLLLMGNAGATFIARGTTYHVPELIDIFEKAILHRGFSVVDVITQCPISFGRYNPVMTGKTAPEMLKWIRDNTISTEEATREVYAKDVKKIVRGIFVDRKEPELVNEYRKIIKKAQAGSDK